MTDMNIRLADKVIRISTQNSYLLKYGTEYMVPEDCIPDFTVSIAPSDLDYERSMNTEGTGNDAMLEAMAVYRKIAEEMIDYNTLLFHGSAVCVDGNAYLFCADSGTGKSTHTRLWREVFGDRAVMINDDKPLICIDDEGIRVCGTPWSGKHHLDTNMSALLKGIAFLNRDTVNHIEAVNKNNALPMLMRYCYRSKDPQKLKKELELLDKMSKSIRCYTFGCDISHEAVHVSYNGMLGGMGQ